MKKRKLQYKFRKLEFLFGEMTAFLIINIFTEYVLQIYILSFLSILIIWIVLEWMDYESLKGGKRSR